MEDGREFGVGGLGVDGETEVVYSPPMDLPGLETRTIGAKPPAKLRPNHLAIMSAMVTDPSMTQRELARMFGVTESWLSVVVNCDIFQEELNARLEGKIFGPATASLREKVQAAAHLAVDALSERIPLIADPEVLLSTADKLLHRLGFAPKVNGPAPGSVTINNTTNILPVAPDVLAQARAVIGAKTSGAIDVTPTTAPQLSAGG